MPPKKKEEPKEKPILGRFRSHLKVGQSFTESLLLSQGKSAGFASIAEAGIHAAAGRINLSSYACMSLH